MTFTISEAEKTDALLLEYHDYSKPWMPPLDYPATSAACREARSSRQWEDATEASCGGLHEREMKSVEFCLDQLPREMSSIIQREMKNRAERRDAWRQRSSHKVWRQRDVFPSLAYLDARALIIPLMRKECLLA